MPRAAPDYYDASRGAYSPPRPAKVFVLLPRTTEDIDPAYSVDDVEQIFQKHGRVLHTSMAISKRQVQIAFITFENPEDAAVARRVKNHSNLGDRKLTISFAKDVDEQRAGTQQPSPLYAARPSAPVDHDYRRSRSRSPVASGSSYRRSVPVNDEKDARTVVCEVGPHPSLLLLTRVAFADFKLGHPCQNLAYGTLEPDLRRNIRGLPYCDVSFERASDKSSVSATLVFRTRQDAEAALKLDGLKIGQRAMRLRLLSPGSSSLNLVGEPSLSPSSPSKAGSEARSRTLDRGVKVDLYTLFLPDVDTLLTETDLRAFFAPFGSIASARVHIGSPHTVAFVTFEKPEDARGALEVTSGKYLRSKVVNATFCERSKASPEAALPSKTLFVSQIDPSYSSELRIVRAFADAGCEPQNIRMPNGSIPNTIAFLFFRSLSLAESAKREMHGKLLGSQRLEVAFAKAECRMEDDPDLFRRLEEEDRLRSRITISAPSSDSI
ncbi:hypothetical protein BDY24DRAFT_370381 [Mrakia frigida]|uniref:uncharacterized protein n=1 Tax=Mrakia frigida TaxID=29902 RepID=UPI003FCC0A77